MQPPISSDRQPLPAIPDKISDIVVLFLSAAFLLAGIYLSSFYNYLLFHSLSEGFSIIIACGVFMVAWNTRRFTGHHFLLFIGIAYLFVGILDFAHVISYEGMNIIEGYGPNAPTQLWIASRYMESLTLLVAPFMLRNRIEPLVYLLVYAVLTVLVLLSIFVWRIFPDSFLPATGLTTFKIVSEYIICAILVVAGINFLQHRTYFNRGFLALSLAAIAMTIVAELAFTTYASVFGFANLLGHLFKIISFYLIYKAVIETGLTRPYELLFRDLYRQREHLRVTLTSIGDAVITTDGDGRATFLNPVAESLTGWSDAEARGKPLEDVFRIINRDSREVVDSPVHKVLATGKIVLLANHTLLIRRDGLEIPIDDSASPILNREGHIQGVVLIFRDVTEREQAEAALKASEEKFSKAFFISPTFLFISEVPTGIFVEVNEAYCSLTGWSRDELIGHTFVERNMIPAESRAEIYKHLQSTGKVEMIEIDIVTKKGRSRPVLFSAEKITYLNKECLVCSGIDMTERKKAEEEVAAANKELEAFSYSVSHDLSAPLRAMHGFSSFLLENYNDALDDKGQSYLQRIVAGAEKMQALINDILKLSQISRQELVFEKINFNTTVREIIRELQNTEPERSVDIRIQDCPEAVGDADLMKIALANLIGNAWKYTGKTADPVIEFGCLLQENGTIFFVRDNGVGFPAERAEDVFTPFERLHSESEFPGTGIGLATVQRIINRHGGRIWAESQSGSGSTFFFTCNGGQFH